MPLSLFGLSTLHKGLMSSVLSIRLSVTPLSQDWLKRFSDFSHEARIHKHKCDKTHFLREILMPKIEEMPKVKIFELSSKSIH